MKNIYIYIYIYILVPEAKVSSTNVNIDNTFDYFSCHKEAINFFILLNNLHISLLFRMEEENNMMFPFLDILVKRTTTKYFVISIYRKSIFTGLFLSFLVEFFLLQNLWKSILLKPSHTFEVLRKQIGNCSQENHSYFSFQIVILKQLFWIVLNSKLLTFNKKTFENLSATQPNSLTWILTKYCRKNLIGCYMLLYSSIWSVPCKKSSYILV